MPGRLHRIEGSNEIEAKREEWIDFASRCQLAAPFCGPRVWIPWLLTCAPSGASVFEWRRGGELKALVPMFRNGSRLEMAAGPHLDYQDLAAVDHEAASGALLALVSSEGSHHSCLVFPKVAEGTRLAAALADPRVDAAAHGERRYWSRCPVSEIACPAGTGFLSALPPRQRKDYRNASRRLSEAFPDAVVSHHGPGRIDPALLDEAAALHRANQYRKKGGSVCSDPSYLAFLKALEPAGAPLCLSLLREEPGGALMAFHLGFFDGATYFYYLTAYSGEHSRLSPGRWLLVDSLRHWHERGGAPRLRLDMLCGEEEYKSRWPATPYLVSRVLLIPRRFANLPRILAYSAVYGLKNAKNRRFSGRAAGGVYRKRPCDDLALPG